MGGGVNGWRIPTNVEDWMRQVEKKSAHQDRRPSVSQASTLMGPTLGPHVQSVSDVSAEEATFNGFYYVPLGTPNSPDPTFGWMGQTIAQADGYGIQILEVMHNSAGTLTGGTPQKRRFWAPGGATLRLYSTWGTS